MLTHLAIGLLALTYPANGQVPRLSSSDVPSVLESIGYPLTDPTKGLAYATITHAGATVKIGTRVSSKPGDYSEKPWLSGFDLEIEIPVGEDIPLSQGTRSNTKALLTSEVEVVPHLGRTVTLKQGVALEYPYDKYTLIAAFDKFWQFGANYARVHKGAFVQAPEVDWTKVRFPDAYLLDRVDAISLKRAVASWGMLLPPKNPMTDMPTMQSLTVDGVPLTLAVIAMGSRPMDASFVLNGMIQLPRDVDAQAWSKERGGEIKLGKLLPQFGSTVRVSREFKINTGVRLADIRQAILTFGSGIKALHNSLR